MIPMKTCFKVDIMENLMKTCPRCGKDSLAKELLPNGRYRIKCTTCGLVRGDLPPDTKKGVV